MACWEYQGSHITFTVKRVLSDFHEVAYAAMRDLQELQEGFTEFKVFRGL